MALPFLPGYVFNNRVGKEKFHKSHYFEKRMGLGHLYYDNKPGIGGEPLPGQRIDPPTSKYPEGRSKAPAWLAFDKQVLSFEAYFQQAVHESHTEQYRVRRCLVYFYLEDDTIQVIEPRILNSALPQGTIVRRHRIRKPPPNDSCYYTVNDFNVGMDLELYGRVYRLVSCDPFTADFLRHLGVRVNEPEPIPDDPYTSHRLAISDAMQPKLPVEKVDTLRQFLDHDRQVLRFFCFWDDTNSLYGDARDFVLHYFLADDTIAIYERIEPNSGRDAVPCFLRRQKLPKLIPNVPLPGTVTKQTILNTMGTAQNINGYLLDRLKDGSKKVDCYTDRDLTLGAVINVLGRKFLICDCDEFTKEYYRKRYGITEFTPTKPQKPNCTYALPQENPPFNGWGTDEDSLSNCRHLIPTAAKKGIEEKCEADILRFTAHLIAGVDVDPNCKEAVDRSRSFIISCFLRDNTFMVYEPPVTNSGFKGGKFMERRKVMKPGQPIFRTELPLYYGPSDVFLGAQLVFNNFVFEIYGADEHALTYMETHPAEFPLADAQSILRRLRPLVRGREEVVRRMAAEADPEGVGHLDFEKFGCFVRELMKCASEEPVCLVTHEVVALARHYALETPKQTNYMAAIGMAQQQLHRVSFEAYQELLDACRYEDFENTGCIDCTTLRRICRANHLPLPDDILRTLMEISENFDNGKIYYESFINQLNWRCNPVPTGTVPCEFSGNLEVDWARLMLGTPDGKLKSRGCLNVYESFGAKKVRHMAFVEDLTDLSKCTE